MIRHRYIRFFISSTFLDMSKERNLLQLIFTDLNSKYAAEGWLIEYVDLRWGITREAGLDNRTIRICLEELERCRVQSPKPNFILLLGERNGWIPLLEEVSEQDAIRVLNSANKDETHLFKTWYRFDYNRLESPAYLLQPRTDRYVDDTVWENEVYKPLSALFARTLHKTVSATAHEIQHGIRTTSDAENAVAYFRIISGASESFRDTDTKEIESLKMSLRRCIPADNIYEERLTARDYRSDVFDNRFKETMTRHLCNVIDRVISQYKVQPEENLIHADIAETESRSFIGREEELAMAADYINDRNANYALLLKGISGVGKSALISKIAEQYKDSHDVIVRFCGQTERSNSGYGVLDSVWRRMRELYPIGKHYQKDIPKPGQRKVFEIACSATDLFRSRMKGLRCTKKPMLILIDGIDNLPDSDSDEFFSLDWADNELSPDIRIILTSTDDPRINPKTKNIIIRNLPVPKESDAVAIIDGLLRMSGRTLSSPQHELMERAVAASDKRPVFLALLAGFFKKIPSYERIKSLPVTLEGLVRLIFERTTSVSNHDPELVRRIYTLLTCAHYGLSHTEILEAVATDNMFMEHLADASKHIWNVDNNNPSIPPAMWSRLYADTSFFFRTKYTSYGQLLDIRHNELRKVINNVFISESHKAVLPYMTLLDYFRKQQTSHAAAEIIYCGYKACTYAGISRILVEDIINRLKEVLYDPGFLYRLKASDPYRLASDLDMMVDLLRKTGDSESAYVLRIKNDMAVSKAESLEQFRLECLNMHPDSPLRQMAETEFGDKLPVLKNAIVNLQAYNLAVASSGKIGAVPMISDDGLNVLSHYDNLQRVRIENMVSMNDSMEYRVNTPILDFCASADLKMNAFLTATGFTVYDTIKRRTTFGDYETKDIKWITLSADGRHFAYGADNECYIDNCLTVMWNVLSSAGCLSPSGNNLWVAMNGEVIRTDLSAQNEYRCAISDKIFETPRFLAAGEQTCVLITKDILYIIHTYNVGDKKKFQTIPQHLGLYNTFDAMAAVNGNRVTVILDRTCIIYEVKDYKLEVVGGTEVSDISAISRNGRFVFSYGDRCSYRLDRLMKTVRWKSAWNVGVNTLATDYRGDCIAVTTGINIVQDRCGEALLYNGGKIVKFAIPDRPVVFYSSCAVSPAGDRIWLSDFGMGSSLFVLDSDHKVVKEIQEAGHQISMTYTYDSRWVIGSEGEYIADGEAIVRIFTANGELLSRFSADNDKGLITFKGHTYLTQCNRYLITSEGDIIDLIDEKLVFEAFGSNAETPFSRSYYSIIRSDLFAVNPIGVLIIGNRMVHFDDGYVEEYSDETKCIGCSRSGRYLFELDSNRTLYVDDCAEDTKLLRLADSVDRVYPSFNERYAYVLKIDGTILLMDIFSSKVLQEAFCPDCADYKVTYKGLVAVTRNGQLSIFTPDPQFKVESESTVSAVRRWDLATKQQSSKPTAICPVCTREFPPDASILQMIGSFGVPVPGDWNNSALLSRCPHCGAHLRFTPFIVE